jgi:hypothetical protein
LKAFALSDWGLLLLMAGLSLGNNLEKAGVWQLNPQALK